VGVNLLVALGAWIGLSVPVALALGVVLGRTKEATSADRLSLSSVSGRHLTRV
jgi:hypothetical protein